LREPKGRKKAENRQKEKKNKLLKKNKKKKKKGSTLNGPRGGGERASALFLSRIGKNRRTGVLEARKPGGVSALNGGDNRERASLAC